ncbi:Dihydroorotase [Drechslerella dactyloides]|uniref:Dihydroorotase n=1 Tax=Drechslerella dactyloides TaxID=74499 RepID=A0AAD6IT30_DREDA|nr:Dihydroorotase [Drechslerella dactyloides]
MLASRMLNRSSKSLLGGALGKRSLATVTGSTGRLMPKINRGATPVSHDRATFTIRVCLVSLTTSLTSRIAD